MASPAQNLIHLDALGRGAFLTRLWYDDTLLAAITALWARWDLLGAHDTVLWGSDGLTGGRGTMQARLRPDNTFLIRLALVAHGHHLI